MSNLIEHAKKELKLIGADDKDSMYGGMLYDSCIELIDVFSKQGHSGNSASIVREIFHKLADFKPLSKLTLLDDEWNAVSETTYQNRRNSAVFKEGKDGRAHYIDAFYKKTQTGSTWSGSLDLKNGRCVRKCYIKDTAKMPRICIDVIEVEVRKDDLKMTIKDESQLDELRKFYDLDIDIDLVKP